jgi:hypothetical protein
MQFRDSSVCLILSRSVCVTIEGVWIGEYIYWTLTDRNYTNNYNTISIFTLYSSTQHTV